MSKPTQQWRIPHAATSMDVTVRADRNGCVELWTPNLTVGPETLTPLEAARLGQALLEASAFGRPRMGDKKANDGQ